MAALLQSKTFRARDCTHSISKAYFTARRSISFPQPFPRSPASTTTNPKNPLFRAGFIPIRRNPAGVPSFPTAVKLLLPQRSSVSSRYSLKSFSVKGNGRRFPHHRAWVRSSSIQFLMALASLFLYGRSLMAVLLFSALPAAEINF